MKKILLTTVAALMLAGCSNTVNRIQSEPPQPVITAQEYLETLPPLAGPMIVAVYEFQDKTGQRKPSERLANISTAVTQGADEYVIKALREVGQGTWFKVVERGGLENLSRERQIIRQTRESVGDETQLAPLMFAGLLVEGAVVGYDSNTLTGGAGARYLGIGPSTQYREDVITVTMRCVSVQTGEVLTSSAVTKTVLSTSTNLGAFRFIEAGTQAVELEIGNSQNESVNHAVRLAIQAAIMEMIKEGIKGGYWQYDPKYSEDTQ
jgi:curli production assembly/transport component CsgG